MDRRTPGMKCGCFSKLFGYKSLKEVKKVYLKEKEDNIWKRHEYLKLLIFKYSDLKTEEEKVQMYITVRFALVKLLDYVWDDYDFLSCAHSCDKMISVRGRLAGYIKKLQEETQ